MTIELKKFGITLVSRPAGREAFQAIRPLLKTGESVRVDFDGVLAVTPSWVDEFLTLLLEHTSRVELMKTDNASVLATLRVLAEANQGAVADLSRKFLHAQ
ncbi:MAG: DUF4325 domain-containing protein [Candidatus Yanofskybacteria bacterium]|nr:DUF4325 domain-containing protein [Candidatus Yanofskybacteria bacterium]